VAIKEYKDTILIDDIELELKNIEKIEEEYPFVMHCLGFYAGVL
jgi:hypothetical protein